MKNCILILSLVFLLACEKEYFPDPNAYRDSNLFGTWIRLQFLREEADNPLVFDSQGYCGSTVGFINSNTNELSYQDIDGIWYVEERTSKNNLIHSKKRFRNGIWEHTEEYYFQNDTLFLRDLRYDWDTLVKYKYQLEYDGPNYVGLDSIN
jgi:hypothetical protein